MLATQSLGGITGRGTDMPEVVVVTGASAGVGRAVVRELAAEGASIGLIARGAAGLEGARADVERLGARALVVPADVADHDQVEAAAARIQAELGPIDVWINNAMATILAPLSEIEPDEFRRSTEVTYLGSVWGTMAALRRMRPRDRGTIVQVGSALAYRGIPLQAPYCGAKHALQGFLESLRAELLHEGSNVRVSMVQLPAVNTPQFTWARTRMPKEPQPVPPIFQPEVAAKAIVWAARNPRRELMVGWPTVKAILGNAVAPGLADLYLADTGYDAQQRDEPHDPSRPDNLFEPVDEDRGAHGPFDDESRDRSIQAALSRHRRSLGLGAIAATVAGTAMSLARRG